MFVIAHIHGGLAYVKVFALNNTIGLGVVWGNLDMMDAVFLGQISCHCYECSVLYHPTLDRYLLHSDRIPHTWMMMSLNICSTALQYMASSLSLLLPSDHLLPSNLFLSELTTHHIISSFPQSLADIHTSHDLSHICSPYHCGEKM